MIGAYININDAEEEIFVSDFLAKITGTGLGDAKTPIVIFRDKNYVTFVMTKKEFKLKYKKR